MNVASYKFSPKKPHSKPTITPLQCFTLSFVFPVSILRRSVPARTLSLAATAGKDFKLDKVLTRGKVVLVVGVTPEMGYDIIMQYANNKDTTLIGLAQTSGESRFF